MSRNASGASDFWSRVCSAPGRFRVTCFTIGVALVALALIGTSLLQGLSLRDPDQPDASTTAEEYFALGELAFEAEDYSLAFSYFYSALEADPQLARAHAYIGQINYMTNNPDSALENLDCAIELNNSIAESYHFRGLIKYQGDFPERATPDLLRALELGLDSDTENYELGVALATLDRARDSITALDRAIVINPDLVNAYRMRGLVHYQLGEMELAIRQFRIVIWHFII